MGDMANEPTPETNSLQGKLLVAGPALGDPNFAQTVALMVEHNGEGALGLVLNRPTDISIADVWSQLDEDAEPIEGVHYRGGPCEGVLMVLHTHASASQVEVCPGLHFATEESHLRWLMRHNTAAIRYYVGYAGWTGGQLEAELETGSWLLAPASAEMVFNEENGQWLTLMKQIDPTAARLATNPRLVPDDPSVN